MRVLLGDMRTRTALLAMSLLLAACQASGLPGLSTPGPSTPPSGGHVPLCEAVPLISAPAELYRDRPVYVANEMPAEQVRAWASSRPGFVELWIDREHRGWITVAFESDAADRQRELEEAFPGEGVVAVEVDWTIAELEELQRRVAEELSPHFSLGTGIDVQRGVVSVHLGFLLPERVVAVVERFAGERICLEGADPADAPAPGPQASGGDGWRLLVDERGAGHPYRTGIATDAASLRRLWTEIGLPGTPPAVDFQSEVVIWFGAVHGSSCPNLRLDEVVVDRERALVHAEIVLPDAPVACTDDANPYAYLVALQRDRLPAGSFAIQLGSDDPPAGVPEERTVVDVDLSRPGAVAGPAEVHGDPQLPGPDLLGAGEFLEPGFSRQYRLNVHCGIEWLGMLNDVHWRTDVPAGVIDHVPPEWRASVDSGQQIELTLVLTTDPEPFIAATAAGHTVEYRPADEAPPGCD